MNGYIYKLTLLINTKTYKKGETYIGQHKGNRSWYITSGRIPLSIIAKYGKKVFKRTIIMDNLSGFRNRSAWECFYINLYQTNRPVTGKGLNLNDGKKMYFGDRTGENNPNYGNTWSPDMRSYMSYVKTKYYKENPEAKEALKASAKKGQEALQEKLKDPEYKKEFGKKVSARKTRNTICKFSKERELIKEYSTIHEVLEESPEYTKSTILSTCNGWKNTYKGYIWRYRNIETGLIVEPEKKR